MGSPDPRQIDGIGGAHPLTSKVAIVSHLDAIRTSTSTTSSCRSASTSPSSATRRPAATCWPASARSRSSAVWSRRTTMRRPCASGLMNTGDAATAVFPTPGGRAGLRRRHRDRRRARHRCPHRPRAGVGSAAAADRQRRRRDRGASRAPSSTTGCRSCCCAPTSSASRGDESPAELEARPELATRARGAPPRGRDRSWASATCRGRPCRRCSCCRRRAPAARSRRARSSRAACTPRSAC